MAAGKNYDMTVHPTAGLVRSASDGAAAHHVTLASCDCADFINRKGRLVEMDGGTVAVTVCKHVAEFLARAGGWHRTTEPAEAVVLGGLGGRARADLDGGLVFFPNITDVTAKAILRGSLVGMSAGDSNALFREAAKHVNGTAEFKAALCGATVDGQVEVDKLRGRCTLTLYPGR
jgi:hypothetical protein